MGFDLESQITRKFGALGNTYELLQAAAPKFYVLMMHPEESLWLKSLLMLQLPEQLPKPS